jgi:hypothetical protein
MRFSGDFNADLLDEEEDMRILVIEDERKVAEFVAHDDH